MIFDFEIFFQNVQDFSHFQISIFFSKISKIFRFSDFQNFKVLFLDFQICFFKKCRKFSNFQFPPQMFKIFRFLEISDFRSKQNVEIFHNIFCHNITHVTHHMQRKLFFQHHTHSAATCLSSRAQSNVLFQHCTRRLAHALFSHSWVQARQRHFILLFVVHSQDPENIIKQIIMTIIINT